MRPPRQLLATATVFAAGFLCLASAHPTVAETTPAPPAPIATAATAAEDEDYADYAPLRVSDPFEGFNRYVFTFNDWTYGYVVRPAITGYEFVVRPPINRAIGHFYDNVRYPVRVLNALLQGKFSRADLETRKFVVNTLGGLGGFIRQSDNVPSLASVPGEDFGQTLGVWGVPHGPYLVLPILGGTSLRDLGGRAADTVVSPTGWEYIDLANREWVAELSWEFRATITITDTMSTLPFVLDIYDDMKASAVDPYLSVRDALRRYRDSATAR